MGKVLLEISGYINPMPSIEDTMTLDDLRDIKIDVYSIFMADLNYRLEIAEGDSDSIDTIGSPIDSSNWESSIDGYQIEDESAFRKYVINEVYYLIVSEQLPIKEIQFDEYLDGYTTAGYDYVAVVDIDLNEWYQKFKSKEK